MYIFSRIHPKHRRERDDLAGKVATPGKSENLLPPYRH